ncbi:FlaA1/EpsC-like NDP-sugar epimerase [Sinorhizobium fredii]
MVLQGLNEDLALPLLLRRPAIKEGARIRDSLRGRRVLVTGAGGSIGSELCLQIAMSSPAALVLVDHSELNLHEISTTLDGSQLSFSRMAALADVRDIIAMQSLFRQVMPEIVFHAAALKHVPLLENDHNLIEAVRTNVGGTKAVADLCCAAGADMVLISTDKAVNPSSGMGLTKRVAEIYVQALASRHSSVRLAQVRFGNVLGSSGSVVPLFRRQIAQGGPVTVTHAEMTRYLMTIKEAVTLTLEAADLNHHADGYGSYVLDMGRPVKIIDLARQLIEQSGLRPEIDIAIEIIGVRPGEKLVEELVYNWETVEVTPVAAVLRLISCFDPGRVAPEIDLLLGMAELRDTTGVKKGLTRIVPEYQGEVIF